MIMEPVTFGGTELLVALWRVLRLRVFAHEVRVSI